MGGKEAERPSRSNFQIVLVLIGILLPAVLVVMLLALHQFYPHHPVVDWLWKALWGFVAPALIVACLWMVRRRRR